MNRRTVLASVNALLVAGCVADDGTGGSTRESETSTDLDIETRLKRMNEIPYDLIHVARTNDIPAWAEGVGRPAGTAELFASSAATLERIPFEHVEPSQEEAVRAFVEETDFDRARLLYVVVVGLGNAELRVGVDRLGIHDDELVGSVTAQNAEEGDSIDTYASAIVRATVDDRSPPAKATIHVDAIHDRETVVEATVD
jgi:hypothetical protein